MDRRVVWLALSMLVATHGAWAAVPNTFTVQGVLRDGSGNLQSMSVKVSVTLFDAQTNGNQISQPASLVDVQAVDGLFTLAVALPSYEQIKDKPQVWLELVVGNDTYPRQLVTSQIFAFMASRAEEADKLSVNCVGCVGTSQIADGAVTPGKLSSVPAAKSMVAIQGNSITIQEPVINVASLPIKSPGPGVVALTANGKFGLLDKKQSHNLLVQCWWSTSNTGDVDDTKPKAAWSNAATDTAAVQVLFGLTDVKPLSAAAGADVTFYLNCKAQITDDPMGMSFADITSGFFINRTSVAAMYFPAALQ